MQGATQSTSGANGDDEPNKKYWFLNIKRYRRFFNIDTEVMVCSQWLCMQQRLPRYAEISALGS